MKMKSRCGCPGLALVVLASGLALLPALSQAASQGADITIGGFGSEPGKFVGLVDIAFDAQDNLYTLETRRRSRDKTEWEGNGRIQKFDNAGKFISQYAIADEALGEADMPRRLAVDAKGRAWVTRPSADLVRAYAPDGKPLWDVAVTGAIAVTTWGAPPKQLVVAIGSARRIAGGKWTSSGGESLTVVDPDTGRITGRVPLERTMIDAGDMTADRDGNFYIIAATNQIYKFSTKGRLLRTIGSASKARNSDGSQPLHTVAVDSRGNLYSTAWGNPSLMTRYDAELATVWQREGQYKWADPWGPNGDYTPMAVDGKDRLWVAGVHEGTRGNSRYHPAPSVMRTQADFLQDNARGVTKRSARLLGFSPALTTALPYDVAYDLSPVPVEFSVGAATRLVDAIHVNWEVVDFRRQTVGKGAFDMDLVDGVAATNRFDFTPPALGWYTVSAVIEYRGERLRAIGRHVCVTQEYPGMPRLAEGESKGGWTDAPRQVFAGLHNMRLHVTESKDSQDALEAALAQAKQYGATTLVQISDKKHCTPEIVRELVTRFKGKVPGWEFVNEPNFSMSPEDCAQMYRALYPIVKEIDPQAKVMGPVVCGIILPWHERFFKAGGGAFIDILSVHDYEGHESIDPVHWPWKFGALRAMMKEHGCGDKPVWQTERVITGIRGDQFLGPAQAVRTTLHRDLLETLGIPPEHNNHYYLNQGGYSAVPSFLWSQSGPFPGIPALRVRHAMTQGRRYAGTLDFGALGNRLFMGLRYTSAAGSTVVLRNLGLAKPETMELGISAGSAVEVVDAFGNRDSLPVKDGKIRLAVPQMPVYLRLARDQNVTAPVYDFGRNLAPRATFVYSGQTDRDYALLNNGVIETTHAGSPVGGTDGKKLWIGKVATDDKGLAVPETLDIVFDSSRTVDTLFLQATRPDNAFTALLDYDVQYRAGGTWIDLAQVRSACPPSDLVETFQSDANTWILDDNLHLVRFKPVAADALRLVVKRTTHGFFPDAVGRPVDKLMAQALMLREVEVFGPKPAIAVELAAEQSLRTAAFERDALKAVVENPGDKPFTGVLNFTAPEGWRVTPAAQKVDVAPGRKATFAATLAPPPTLSAGPVFVDVALADAVGKTLDRHWARIQIAPPFTAQPQPVKPADKDDQPFAVKILNNGETPLSGRVKLELAGLPTPKTTSADFGPVAPGESAEATLNLSAVNLLGRALRAVYTVEADRMQVVAEQDLSVREWSVVGPFAKDFDKDFGPESTLDLKQTYADPMGNEQRWKTATSRADGLLELSPHFQPNRDCCAYAAAWVQSPKARAAVVAVGSDDGSKAWFNGREILASNTARGAVRGQDRAHVELKAGWNVVLLKVTQGDGGWGFYFDLLDPATGLPIADLVYSPVPVR